MSQSRQEKLIPIIQEVLETTSGFDLTGMDNETTFLEMGLDSLSLTQVALDLKNKFKVNITFRQLMEDYPNLETLAEFFDQNIPPEMFNDQPSINNQPTPVINNPLPVNNQPTSIINNQLIPIANNQISIPNNNISLPSINPANMNNNQAIVAQQLQIMSQQLRLLGGNSPQVIPNNPVQNSLTPQVITSNNGQNGATPQSVVTPCTDNQKTPEKSEETTDFQKRKGPGAKIKRTVNVELTPDQKAYIESVIERYTSKTPESKRQTQQHRRYFADPRTVSGFNPLIKEMVYPLVVDRSLGSRIWDVDGNEYIDITNGFGVNFFGWSDPEIMEAVEAQLKKGIEIGPQTPLAGEVAQMITEMTGLDRVTFCNTGSEAVMAAMRLARTVTGKKKIVTFDHDYHGTFDEAVYRQGPNYKAFPSSPGICPSMVENLVIPKYGDSECLEFIRNNLDDVAAILVETVQSRNPDLQPREFIQELRRMTEKSETALIMDEVITGFRTHPAGASHYYGIKPDLATYGKVIGGTMPLGVVAGICKYMDALDGGYWEYGDNSVPEVGVTFFAGTFVRHPLAMAAAHASLTKLKREGPKLQEGLNAKMTYFATHLNEYFKQVGAPIHIEHFSSFFYTNYPREVAYGSLLFYLLREKGIHIQEDRPCLFNLCLTDEDLQTVIWAFKDSVAEMQIAGLLPTCLRY
jgi:glutamate-1-semialdehyde aminotransferase/acyl carrier protein